MEFIYTVGGLFSFLVFVYLLIALLVPEKF
jgi:K+-transporting ATPase KdpF subunit